MVVVDDRSTDDSRLIADGLAGSDSRVQVLAHDRNLGHIQTYNDGLQLASGDYVVLLSADDLLSAGALARSCALLERRPDVGLVYGNAVEFTEIPPLARTNPTSWTVWSGETWLDLICRRGMNVIVNPEAMLRRSLMENLAGYNPELPHSADMDLWMRAAHEGNVGRVNGVDQAFYRVHGDNMHTKDFSGVLTDMLERRKVFDGLFDERSKLVDAPRFRARARRSLASEAIRCACLALDSGGSHGGASAEEYADFALECHPEARTSFGWKAYSMRGGRAAGQLHRSITMAASSMRWKTRWRRSRRFGT